MKKPSLEQVERQARIARYRLDGAGAGAASAVPPANRYVPPGEWLSAPRRFDAARGSGIEVAKFLRAMATTVLVNKVQVELHFRFTESFYPAGTILLFAEVDRVVSISALPKPITIIDPRLRRPREVLKQSGVRRSRGIAATSSRSEKTWVYRKATKGLDQSGDQMEMLERVAERVNKAHARRLELSGAWRGVSEAVANSVEHAYRFPRSDGFAGLERTRWSMFTQLRDGIFTMAVCDLGCGYRATIGQTLPEKFVAGIAYDASGGATATRSRSRRQWRTAGTGSRRAERGKGSRDAISVLQKHRVWRSYDSRATLAG